MLGRHRHDQPAVTALAIAILVFWVCLAKADDSAGSSAGSLAQQRINEAAQDASRLESEEKSLDAIIDQRKQNNSGNAAGAQQALQQALGSGDNFTAAAAYNELSRAFLIQNQPGQAAAAAQQAANLNPSYGEAYTNAAMAKYAMGDIDGAKQLADQGVSIWPDHAPAVKAQQVVASLAQAQQSMGAGPGRSATLGAGPLWGGANPGSMPAGRNPKASGGPGGPASSDAPANLRGGELSAGAGSAAAGAGGLLAIGDARAAATMAQQEIAEHPQDGGAHLVLAKADNVLGQYDKAVGEATKAIELGADHVDALNARAYAQNNLGNPKSALMDADVAAEISPRDGLARLNRAQALESLGQTKDALKEFQRAAKLNPAFRKAFEAAYARNAKALGLDPNGAPDGAKMGLGGLVSSKAGKMGLVTLGAAGLLGFLALKFAVPKPDEDERASIQRAFKTTTPSRRRGHA